MTESQRATIDLRGLARILGITEPTAELYARRSVPDWKQGRDSPLMPRPLPEHVQGRHGRGHRRLWDLTHANAFAAQPKRRGARPRGPRPTTADLDAALAGTPPPNSHAALAEVLSDRTGVEVNARTAARLLRQRREQALAAIVDQIGTDRPTDARRRLAEAVPYPLGDQAWKPLWDRVSHRTGH